MVSMRFSLFFVVIVFVCIPFLGISQSESGLAPVETKLLVYGGDIQPRFVELAAKLTGKPKPRVCYLPTASADDERNIRYWERICSQLPVQPFVLKVWVSSDTSQKSFAEILGSMDAIVVGGGNTLNMLGIWHAQGIDTLLQQAYRRGVVLSGGSAGSLCWFQTGVSDSRPERLSLITGLGLLPYSNCPHYRQASRRKLYEALLLNGKAGEGYGCDDQSAILFRDGKFHSAYSTSDVHHSYAVKAENGVIVTDTLRCSILVADGAVPADSIGVLNLNKTLEELGNQPGENSPLGAFVAIKTLLAKGQTSKLAHVSAHHNKSRLKPDEPDQPFDPKSHQAHMNTLVYSVLLYDNRVAGVVNKMYEGVVGVWYFYNEGGKWLSAGEDFGGSTPFEAQISFREKVRSHLKQVGQ